MTPSELLALVGRSWSRLLLYPGGLALLLALLVRTFSKQRWGVGRVALLPLAAPWLAVALLPLPGAVDLGRGIDAVVITALFDLPLLHTLAIELRGDATQRVRGARRLAAALNGYPALLLALLLLVAGNGSLELAQLARVPAQPEVLLTHWVGAVALVLALPPVLGIGAFATPEPPASLEFALRLRQIGYVLLALLPLIAGLDNQIWQALPLIVVPLTLWLFHQLTRNHTPRRWAWTYLALDLLLLVALLASAAWSLNTRLA